MVKRKKAGGWAAVVSRSVRAASQLALRLGRLEARRLAGRKARPTAAKRASAKPAAKAAPARAAGRWLAGIAVGAGVARRYHLFVPAGLRADERPPVMVMLHGCGQDGMGFARSTRMNAVAQRERCLVLYPEQDRLANTQGCWNWFETRTGRAQAEAAAVVAAVDQVISQRRADASRVVICGLSAGASLAALVAARHPERFAAVAMHSGVRPGVARSAATALSAMQGRRRGTAGSLPDGALPPLLVIQGTADPVVVRANAGAAAHEWAHAGDARERSPVRESLERRVQRGSRKPMRIVDFKRAATIVATLIEIDGLGHAWSGGAAGQPYSDPTGPDISRVIWAFAARQFKARSS